MVRIYNSLIVLLWSVSYCLGQPDASSSISLKILDDSLHLNTDQMKLRFYLQCRNSTDSRLLLYGFNSDIRRFVELDDICNLSQSGGGFALFLFDEQGNQQFAEWRISETIDYRPMPKEKLDSIIRNDKIKYLESKVVIGGLEEIVVQKELDLTDFHLRKGSYSFRVVYFSGKAVKDILVGAKQLESDQENDNARLYYGCAISNLAAIMID